MSIKDIAHDKYSDFKVITAKQIQEYISLIEQEQDVHAMCYCHDCDDCLFSNKNCKNGRFCGDLRGLMPYKFCSSSINDILEYLYALLSCCDVKYKKIDI